MIVNKSEYKKGENHHPSVTYNGIKILNEGTKIDECVEVFYWNK